MNYINDKGNKCIFYFILAFKAPVSIMATTYAQTH